MSFRPLLLSLLVAPFILSACDGYEAVLTKDYFPYGNQRTAGSGVAYVLAKMMPAKELNLEPEQAVEKAPEIVEDVPEMGPESPPAVEAPVVEETPMEEIFQGAQKK